uniref:Uncharacterized protein n=1 Tax=Anopheles dirus TaxID=7168 RepID=A0A182MYM8_9DIPT
MKAIACLVFASALAACAVAAITDEQRDAARQLAGQCMQQTGATEDDVKRLRSGETEGADRNSRCFVQCFFHGAGFVDQDGNVQTEELTEKLASEYGQEKADELVARCRDNAGPDACERSFRLFQCYLDNRATLIPDSVNMARQDLVCRLLTVYTIVSIVLLVRPSLGQDVLGAFFRCRNEYDIEPSVFDALRAGNFSVRNSLVECFGECFVKRAGFMNDNFTFNRDTILRFMYRFISSKETAEMVYRNCTDNVQPTYCVTAFEVYKCIAMLVIALGTVLLLLAGTGCHAQDFKGAIDHCTKDFEMDMDIVVSLKYGDFTERDPLIECFTECLMKKSGFMYDDYTYNKTLIIGFAGRYLEPEGAQAVYDNCIDRFGQTVCVTGFEMYQCIHETAVSEWFCVTMKLLLVPVLLAALVAAQPLTDDQMKKAEGFALGCLEQYKGLNKEHLVLLRDGDFSKVDADTKCFLRCFLQQANFMDASGKLQNDYAVERLSLSREKTKVEALVKKCSTAAAETADSCETAFRAVECYHREKASLL